MVACFDAVRLFIFVPILWILQPHFTLWLSARILQGLFAGGCAWCHNAFVLYLALACLGISVPLCPPSPPPGRGPGRKGGPKSDWVPLLRHTEIPKLNSPRTDFTHFPFQYSYLSTVIRPGFTMGLAGLKPGASWQVGLLIPSKKISNPAEIACILVAQALKMPVPKPGCSTCLQST